MQALREANDLCQLRGCARSRFVLERFGLSRNVTVVLHRASHPIALGPIAEYAPRTRAGVSDPDTDIQQC
jgi:hypothetical protein